MPNNPLLDFLGLSSPPSPPKEGLYHYAIKNETGKARIHLRIDPGGQGVLLVNAQYVYYLNPTAVYMAYLFLEKIPDYIAISGITKYFQTPQKIAISDYAKTSAQISEIIKPDGVCPVCDLNLETIMPFSTTPSAPYRMDLALTYRCNNHCHHCYNDRTRNIAELDVDHWKRVIDILWEIGIPHIVFTGGEPTLFEGLPELIAHAEALGQITGINTNGRRLKDAAYLNRLIEAGLDHAQITLESHLPEIHDQMVAAAGAYEDTIAGLKNALATRLYVMTNTTMLKLNSGTLTDTLNFLADISVPTVGLNALIYVGSGLSVNTGLSEEELPALLEIARQTTGRNNQRLVWYTPTQYCHFDPIQVNLGVKGCTAALYNMCIDPDGSVLPCQSYYHPLGNILKDSWLSIWEHDLAVSLRERRNVPEECRTCSIFSTCGGGCPLARQADKISPPQPVHAYPFEELEIRP